MTSTLGVPVHTSHTVLAPFRRAHGERLAAARLRTRVWLNQLALCHELAAGADPDSRAELTCLAHQLIGTQARRQLARDAERLMRDAAIRRPPSSELIPLNRRAIWGVREELTELVGRLRDGTPVPVRGMAIVQMLLRDSTGPLYGWARVRDARALARMALDRLEEPIATTAQ